jgi:hypothetical protein
MIDSFDSPQCIIEAAGKMISELQLLSSLNTKLVEDAQYCTHLLVDCVYHLLGPVKLAILNPSSSSKFEMDEVKAAIEEISKPSSPSSPVKEEKLALVENNDAVAEDEDVFEDQED